MERFTKGETYNIQEAIDESMPESIRGEKGARMVYRQWASEHLLEIIQMHFLVSNGLILEGEPFPLTGNTDMWEEIRFYDVREGQTVIDVGAGIGGVSYLLAYTGISLQLYLTEIDELAYEFLFAQTDKMASDQEAIQIQLVVAREKTLGLSEDLKADKILMREVYHHLDYPYHVLADVKKHLSSGGTLILVESVTDLEMNKKDGCRKALSLKKVKNEVTKNGFVLVGQKQVYDRYVLLFQLAKN